MYSVSELISFYQHEKHFPESMVTLSSEALAGKYLENNSRCISKASVSILTHIKEVEGKIIKERPTIFDDIKTKLSLTYNILNFKTT